MSWVNTPMSSLLGISWSREGTQWKRHTGGQLLGLHCRKMDWAQECIRSNCDCPIWPGLRVQTVTSLFRIINHNIKHFQPKSKIHYKNLASFILTFIRFKSMVFIKICQCWQVKVYGDNLAIEAVCLCALCWLIAIKKQRRGVGVVCECLSVCLGLALCTEQ